MKHINLTSFKGSITDWTELNYIQGGLADEYADIANLRLNDELYNYLDFDNQKIIQKVGRVDLGSLDWIYNSMYGSNPAFYCPTDIGAKNTSVTDIFNGLCSKYEATSRDDIYYNVVDKKICLTGGILVTIVDKNYTDAAAFKTAMSGVYLYYELATPIEIDITQ